MIRLNFAPHDAAVVKLGGSLAYSEQLRGWLSAIRSATVPIVIVPGGGPFADTVREAQTRMGLADYAAHRMALLAMAQYAEALASLEPGFAVTAGREGLLAALAEEVTPIWAPLDMLAGAQGIEENWDVTSDSIAAWLAADLGIKTLALVKQVPPPAAMPSLSDMVEKGIVDRAFPSFIEGRDIRVVWLGPSAPKALDLRAERLSA